jgi:hypothetical protein
LVYKTVTSRTAFVSSGVEGETGVDKISVGIAAETVVGVDRATVGTGDNADIAAVGDAATIAGGTSEDVDWQLTNASRKMSQTKIAICFKVVVFISNLYLRSPR